MNLRLRNRIKDDSPCGVLISTQAEYDPQGLTPRGERKGAKDAKCGEIGKYNSLRSWRLGAKSFLEVVLLNILSAKIYRRIFSCLSRTYTMGIRVQGRRSMIHPVPQNTPCVSTGMNLRSSLQNCEVTSRSRPLISVVDNTPQGTGFILKKYLAQIPFEPVGRLQLAL